MYKQEREKNLKQLNVKTVQKQEIPGIFREGFPWENPEPDLGRCMVSGL